jgi:hypothetical protein
MSEVTWTPEARLDAVSQVLLSPARFPVDYLPASLPVDFR